MTRLLTLGLLMLAFTAQAQLPEWFPDPINQVRQLTKENKRLRADLISRDSLLTVNFDDANKLFDLKDQRISKLKNQADSLLNVENDKCKPLTSAVATLLAGLDRLEQMETDEALRGGLFGGGRRRAARARRAYIIQLKAIIKQQ